MAVRKNAPPPPHWGGGQLPCLIVFLLCVFASRPGSQPGASVVHPVIEENHYEQIRQVNRGPNMGTVSVATHKGEPPNKGASTATRELEDLMESLSEFKVMHKLTAAQKHTVSGHA